MTLLQQRLREQIEQHGTLRATAKALGLDVAYLSRLTHAKMDNPHPELLRKLKLRRVVIFESTDPH